jgi:hypothetical protein
VSHYLFDHHFCQVRRANEKGVVEGTVKFARLQAPPLPPEVVPGPAGREGQGPESRPAPVAAARLRQGQGLDPQIPQITQMEGRGKQRIKGSLCAVFLFFLICVICEICGCLFDACRTQSTVASSESLVRFDDNDYSVPVSYAHHPVVVRGYMDRVEVGCRKQVMAVHPRSLA